MRKVLVANYFTPAYATDADWIGNPYVVAEVADKQKLIDHCKAVLKERFEAEGREYDVKVTDWPRDKKVDISAAPEEDLTGGSLDDDLYIVYFEIAEVDFI